MGEKKIKYWLLKIGKRLDQMIATFKKHITDYNDSELANAVDVFNIVSSSILSTVNKLTSDVKSSESDPSRLSTLFVESTSILR